jgi:hypothetical protein
MEAGLFADALADAGAGDAPGKGDADAFLQGVAGLDEELGDFWVRG